MHSRNLRLSTSADILRGHRESLLCAQQAAAVARPERHQNYLFCSLQLQCAHVPEKQNSNLGARTVFACIDSLATLSVNLTALKNSESAKNRMT